MIKLNVFLFLVVQCCTVSAQFLNNDKNKRPAEGWPADVVEIYQPIVTDTTLLFPAPWLVWQCACMWPDEYEFYYDVDFRTVRRCWGRKEVFDREQVNGVYGFVQHGLGELQTMLEETGDGFLYTELAGDDAEPTRTIELHWDTDQVVRTDTSAVGQWGYDDLVTRITRYVELKPVR